MWESGDFEVGEAELLLSCCCRGSSSLSLNIGILVARDSEINIGNRMDLWSKAESSSGLGRNVSGEPRTKIVRDLGLVSNIYSVSCLLYACTPTYRVNRGAVLVASAATRSPALTARWGSLLSCSLSQV